MGGQGEGRDLKALIRLDGQGDARIRRIAANPLGAAQALYAIDGDFCSGQPRQLSARSPEDIPPALPPAKRLRIFHVNDMHNHLYDTGADGRIEHRLARMVYNVKKARAQAGPQEAVLFLSAGDDHTGTGLDELVGWNADDFECDPGYRALSAAGLDAATIGNHEFDRGSAQLVRGIGEAAFPLLSANVHGSGHLKPGEHFHAALIAQVKGLRVGIIGLTTRVETRVGQPSDPGLAVASPLEVLARLEPLIDPIADVIVILSHCGYGDGAHVSGKASTARDIGEADFALADTAARLATKPTVIIGAHTHTKLNEHGLEALNLRAGIPITQAGANGRFLGEVTFDTATRAFNARLIATDGPTDEGFANVHIAPLIARVSARMGEVIATAPDGNLSWEQTRAARYSGECALANFMNDAMVHELARHGHKADLALLNGASILAGVEGGTLTYAHWFDVMPYSDEVYLVRATGRDIADILQSNARRILRREELAQIDPGGFVARGFLHGSARLRYRIEPVDSAASARASDIRLDGIAIGARLDETFTLAMTTYLALGSFGERWNGAPLSGGVPGDLPGYDLRALERVNTGLVYRQLLADHIRRAGQVQAQCDGRLETGVRA